MDYKSNILLILTNHFGLSLFYNLLNQHYCLGSGYALALTELLVQISTVLAQWTYCLIDTLFTNYASPNWLA